jgi:hypothetical protein
MPAYAISALAVGVRFRIRRAMPLEADSLFNGKGSGGRCTLDGQVTSVLISGRERLILTRMTCRDGTFDDGLIYLVNINIFWSRG